MSKVKIEAKINFPQPSSMISSANTYRPKSAINHHKNAKSMVTQGKEGDRYFDRLRSEVKKQPKGSYALNYIIKKTL